MVDDDERKLAQKRADRDRRGRPAQLGEVAPAGRLQALLRAAAEPQAPRNGPGESTVAARGAHPDHGMEGDEVVVRRLLLEEGGAGALSRQRGVEALLESRRVHGR